jgi:hypothetical protein
MKEISCKSILANRDRFIQFVWSKVFYRAKNTTWNLPGTTGGKTYVLTDNNGEVVTVSTQSFDSAESREAAIRIYNAQSVGRGKPVGSLVVLGQHLIYVTPAHSGILERLAPELKKKPLP